MQRAREAGVRGAVQGTAARGGTEARELQTILERRKNNALRDKTCPGADVARCFLRWDNTSLADKQKDDGREPELGSVARSRKIRTGSKIKRMKLL